MHILETVGAQLNLRRKWGKKNLKLLGTVLAQLRHSWGIKLHGARLGHS